MAVIYLTHPVHGAKVACSDMEADFDEQQGWSRYNLGEETEPEIEPEPEPAARRGRRKKTEEPVPNFLAPQPVEGE